MPHPIRRRAVLALPGLLAGARPGRAQPAGAGPMAAAFADWMAAHGIRSGVVALALDGQLVMLQGFGGADPAARVPVWSLSKYITGLAVARLVGQGRLALDSTLDRLLQRGVPSGTPLAALRLADLLTHRGGLPQRVAGEAVPGLAALLRAAPPQALTPQQLAPATLAVRPERAAGLAYEYANSNFLLAGLAVAEAAGEPYASFTAREVLAPLGLRQPALDPSWGVLGATGGWSLSAPEYLALLLRADARVPPAVAAWMRDPAGKAIRPDGPVSYSLGQLRRPVAGGQTRWHSGSWTYRAPQWGIEASAGSYAVQAADGAAWFAAYRPHPGDAGVAALDRALWQGRRATAAGPALGWGRFVDPVRP